MKGLTAVGFVLLLISGLLFYLTTDFSIEKFQLSHIMGIMGGVGIGLIIGGIVGYSAKGSAIKAERKRQELERLRREKEELERRAAQAERMSQPDYDPQAEELRKAARFFTRK